MSKRAKRSKRIQELEKSTGMKKSNSKITLEIYLQCDFYL